MNQAANRDTLSCRSMPKGRGSLGSGCSGSGAMISKYDFGPKPTSAFRVPRPGCGPPEVARMPVRLSISPMPWSKLWRHIDKMIYV